MPLAERRGAEARCLSAADCTHDFITADTSLAYFRCFKNPKVKTDITKMSKCHVLMA